MALTLSQDDLNAIAALIDARLPANFVDLIITDGQLDGLAGPVQATNQMGDALASASDLALVKAKTDLIGTGSATTSSPVTPTGTLNEITIGDDYLAEHSRAFEWTVDKPAGFNLTDATCWFGAKLEACQKWLSEGSIVDNGDDTLTLTFELPKEKTKSLKPGNYDWSVAVHDVTGSEITKVKSGTNSVTLSKKFTSATS